MIMASYKKKRFQKVFFFETCQLESFTLIQSLANFLDLDVFVFSSQYMGSTSFGMSFLVIKFKSENCCK